MVTDDVKTALFRAHCISLYTAHLWCTYSISKMKKLQVVYIYIRVDNWFRKYGCHGFNRTCFRWYKIFPASWITGTIVYSLCNYCNDSWLHFVCVCVCVLGGGGYPCFVFYYFSVPLYLNGLQCLKYSSKFGRYTQLNSQHRDYSGQYWKWYMSLK